jgi:hypothetical protein
MTKSLAPSGFVETFESSVSRWREDCLRRQKLARRINASASSSSAWQTPISADSGEKATQASHQNSLAKQSGQWPTVTTSRGGDNANSAAVKDRGNGNNLVGVVQQWPTPQARDGKGAPEDLRTENARPLNEVAKVWSTPSVADVTGGRMSRSGDRSNERLLNGQANDLSETWSTPRVSADRTSPTALDRQDSMSKLSIAQQAEMVMGEIPDEIYLVSEKTQRRLGFDPSLLPVQVTVRTGKPHSKERRSLNPLFVEWLMGWPLGWTLLVSTESECWGMASFPSRPPEPSELLPTVSPCEDMTEYGDFAHDDKPENDSLSPEAHGGREIPNDAARHDGGASRPAAATGRNRSSQKRGQDRQSDREFRGDDAGGARAVAQPADQPCDVDMRGLPGDLHATQDEAGAEANLLAGLQNNVAQDPLAGTSSEEIRRWKARMRAELIAIGLPDSAPPAQLSLFG